MTQFPWLKSLLLVPFCMIASHLKADAPSSFTPWGGKSEKKQAVAESKSKEKPSPNIEAAPCDTTVKNPPTTCAYNAPVLANKNAWANLYATGSFIFWRASADYLAPAFLDNSFSSNPGDLANIIFEGKVLEPEFDYKPGYKVGLGYKFHRDRWDLFAEYTRFHQTTHSSHQVTPGGQHMHAVWLVFITPVLINEEFGSYKSKWKTDFDILDAEVGRDFFCGKHLTFRPSLGLRTLWLEQKYDLTYISLVQDLPVFSNNKSSSWAIGPRVALSNTWNLCSSLKIVGDLGISLLHTEDMVTVSQKLPFLLTQGQTSDILYANKEKISLVKPILDLSLGLAWGLPLFHEKCAFDLQVSYDYSIYWDQASIQLGHAPIVAPGSPIQVIVGEAARSTGDISVQGLRVTARFDF